MNFFETEQLPSTNGSRARLAFGIMCAFVLVLAGCSNKIKPNGTLTLTKGTDKLLVERIRGTGYPDGRYTDGIPNGSGEWIRVTNKGTRQVTLTFHVEIPPSSADNESVVFTSVEAGRSIQLVSKRGFPISMSGISDDGRVEKMMTLLPGKSAIWSAGSENHAGAFDVRLE